MGPRQPLRLEAREELSPVRRTGTSGYKPIAMNRRHVLALGGAAIVLGVLAWRPWANTEPYTDPRQRDAPTAQTSAPTTPRTQRQGDSRPSAPKVTTKKRNIDEAERERYRRAIRDAIAQRDTRAKPPTNHDDRPKTDEGGQVGEGLKDRSAGKLAGLMKDLQHDVMPLADECYEQALERDPSIAGGLGLRFSIIGDEDVGGLVEHMELEDGSDIQDPEMLECMRETLLSTIFPAPDDSGEAGVRLTLEFSPDE